MCDKPWDFRSANTEQRPFINSCGRRTSGTPRAAAPYRKAARKLSLSAGPDSSPVAQSRNPRPRGSRGLEPVPAVAGGER
jgi:hypothetical protein